MANNISHTLTIQFASSNKNCYRCHKEMQAIERDALLCPRNAIFLSINEKKERKAFMKN